MQEKLDSMGEKVQPGTHFNGKSQVYNIWLISIGKISGEAEPIGKEGTTRGSFQQEITGLQYLAYLSGNKSEEAELNRKEGTTRGSFQQEILSLGVLNWASSFQIHTLQNLCLSQLKRRDNQGLISMWNYKFRSVKLEVGVSGYIDILILDTYPAGPLSFCDNSMGNILILKRRGGRGWGCAVLLTWGALYGAKNYMAKVHGMTFVPFYNTKMEIMSEKGTKVAWPQCEMWIFIEKGNAVVWPPCKFFQLWCSADLIKNRSHMVWPPCEIFHNCKRKVWQNSLFHALFKWYNGKLI